MTTLADYQFDLPQDLIAQHPLEKRDQSRLMVVDRNTSTIEHHCFSDFINYLAPSDRIIFNNTKVIPARLIGNRVNGGKAEILLIEEREDNVWEVMAKPGKRLSLNKKIFFPDVLEATVIKCLDNGNRVLRFSCKGDFYSIIQAIGSAPLPPYIRREKKEESDLTRYQTVYAAIPGSLAAPTAGLHFTHDLRKQLNDKQVEMVDVTLHVGPGTFVPVKTDDIRNHDMHKETCFISDKAASSLNDRPQTSKTLCVGTTSLRTLESSCSNGLIQPGKRDTRLFIYPGYKFRFAERLLTNFHLPGSTLLMLVSALAGYDLMMEAYRTAIAKRYRFFSYGDAMLIL